MMNYEQDLKVLETIRAHVAQKGYPPTVRWIADTFQWASTTQAFSVLQRLRRAGYLEKRADRKYWPRNVLMVKVSELMLKQLERWAAIDGSSIESIAAELIEFGTYDEKASRQKDEVRAS